MRANRAIVFGLIASSSLVYAMQFSMASVALPELMLDLDAPLRLGSWVFIIFMIGQVVALPVAGRLASQFGSRAVYTTGLTFFALGSLGSALAPTIELLIAARAVQGLAGGALLPAGMGLISDAFGEDRARPIGLMSSTGPIGAIVGPSIGGIIVDQFGWRWTFALNVPLALLVVVAALILIPRSPRKPGARIDAYGAVLLTVAITALVLGLTELGQRDANFPMVLGSFIASGVAVGLLIQHARRVADPIIEVDLLRRREFLYVNTLAFFYGAAIFGIFSVVPLYMAVEYGMTASESGALLTPRAMAMVAGSALAAFALPITGYRKPMIVGLLGMSIALVTLSRGIHDPTIATIGFSSFVWLTAVLIFAGFSFGITNPALSNASLDLAPDRIPSIAGLRGMFMSLGGTIGIAIIALVTSRASSTAEGIELSFIGLAVMLAAITLLVFGIPEKVRKRVDAPELVGSPQTSEAQSGDTASGVTTERDP